MKQKTVTLSKGLYVLRYDSAEDVFSPPKVRISVESGSEGRIALILDPNVSDAVLEEPGSCLVVRAADVGKLRIEVVPARPGGSVAATIKLQSLSDQKGLRERRVPRPLDFSDFRILGHVAGIGDVLVAANQWIGGPMAPSRIEGFAIEWPRQPGDVSIRYAARIGGANPATTDVVNLGAFVGTRGQALPLMGATLEVSGPGALGYQLAVEAVFLGSPKFRVTGERVVLAGPTGQEPLVGLRVALELVNAAAQSAAARETAPQPDCGWVAKPAGDRVDRGSQQQNSGQTQFRMPTNS